MVQDTYITFCNCRKILESLTLAYGQMILKSGFFHADPHPGNILICKGSEVIGQSIFVFLRFISFLFLDFIYAFYDLNAAYKSLLNE